MKIQQLCTIAALATLSTAALAEFPEKPVVLVVPFAAGGPSDKTPGTWPRRCARPCRNP
ncbi:hypothetical protein Y695_02883 [Hydrogenophaga sp. T4]|nr:hypothetical protein Y695_02883 [Hydrogenophaga sp. T4]